MSKLLQKVALASLVVLLSFSVSSGVATAGHGGVYVSIAPVTSVAPDGTEYVEGAISSVGKIQSFKVFLNGKPFSPMFTVGKGNEKFLNGKWVVRLSPKVARQGVVSVRAVAVGATKGIKPGTAWKRVECLKW